MSGLTPEQIERLDGGVREWEDRGGPILNALAPVVAALIAEAVEEARAAAWADAADLADGVIVSWMGVPGLHPTAPEPHPAAIAAAGARRTLVVLRSRVAEAFSERGEVSP